MSENITISEHLVVSVNKDNMSYPERFSLIAGQEKLLETAILDLVKRQYGHTNATPIPANTSGVAYKPVEVQRRHILRASKGYEVAFLEALNQLASDVGAKLLGVKINCWIQVAYSEQTDNGENMFGDYLYLCVRLIAAQ